ncbi:hypothetical protein [Flavobacterium algicola]|uniref:hypothetical protein n=1 Tax=Flavobacterium algicola TaxID=556529 RepID=UPI001EFED037|nr:hypothetical protein [Flavobacterium algicola]MCG9793348.1 hypothetical protein [Flavobacterium algicola]
MIKLNPFLLLIVFLFTVSAANAQYGNSYNNGYGNNNGYGSGRMDRSNQVQDAPEKPKEIPVEVTVGEIMKKMTPELKLDALQEIAIGNVLKESIREQSIILKDEQVGQEQKFKEITALSETSTRKINEYLNQEQKDLYKKWIEQKPSSKKSKRKK